MHPLPLARPRLLFHGSHLPDLTVLKPGADGYLYATPDVRFASIFLSKNERAISFSVNEDLCVFLAERREDFVRRSRSGSIYVIENTHHDVKSDSTSDREWIAETSVQPLMQMRYESALFGMLVHGVKVFFISEDLYRYATEDPKLLPSLWRRLTPEKDIHHFLQMEPDKSIHAAEALSGDSSPALHGPLLLAR